jgi:hypothetical protein
LDPLGTDTGARNVILTTTTSTANTTIINSSTTVAKEKERSPPRSTKSDPGLPGGFRRSPPKSSDVISIEELAYEELKEMRSSTSQEQFFPMACRSLLQELDGNNRCLDCLSRRPEWAAVSYGALVCIQCSGHHRSLGVLTSTVRSITMDHWTYPQVIKMLEGGNQQLQSFFERHALTPTTFLVKSKQDGTDDTILSSPTNTNTNGNNCNTTTTMTAAATATPQSTNSSFLTVDNLSIMRYKTKAALFYRQQLDHHVTTIVEQQKPYRGRRKSRPKRRPLGTQSSTV